MLNVYTLNNRKVIVCSASRIGFDKHENQDSLLVGTNDTDLAVAVCDGLGSAVHSAQGSRKAAELLTSMLLDGSFEKIAFQKAWLRCFPENPQKFNSTAKFISVKRDSISFGGVGDGVIAVRANGQLVTSVSHGEFSNQTSCLFDLYYPYAFSEQSITFLGNALAIISTDGFSEDVKEDGLAILMDAAFDSLGDPEKAKEFDESLENLLKEWPNKTNGDDKTVAFIFVEESGK